MIILLAFALFIIPIAAALKGEGYRGVYVALALVAGLVGFLFMISTGVPAASDDQASLEGAKFLKDYGFAIAGTCYATAFGCVLATALYRKPTTR